MRTRQGRGKVSGGRPSVTVLIVEDHRDQREMYAEYLTAKGMHVLTAPDGLAALQVALAARPHVIVMDLSIPHIDGWETTTRLKNDPRTANIPVIACSAHVLGGATERALVAGCNAFVGKPCLPADLLREIRRVLARAA